tara:strand:- start:3499 stop:3621 length:123 start_codon:yes stop_codon:yes gene_type:complete
MEAMYAPGENDSGGEKVFLLIIIPLNLVDEKQGGIYIEPE